MPTMAELFPLEQLKAQFGNQPAMQPKKKNAAPKANPFKKAFGNKTFQPKPTFGQPQKPAFGQPQQNPGGWQQQKPGQRMQQQQQTPGGPMQLDQIGQLADQIKLAVARLRRVQQFALPGQDEHIGAAKTLLRIAHTAHVTGNHEAVPRHLANASTVMNRIQTKTLGLPEAVTPAKLKKRDQGRDMREQLRTGKMQQNIQKKLTPQEDGEKTPDWQKRRSGSGSRMDKLKKRTDPDGVVSKRMANQR